MREVGGNQRLELGHQLMDALRRQIQTKEFDGDQPRLLGLVRAEHGTQDACADLMKYSEWTESVRRRRADSVRVQRGCSSKEGKRIVTLKHFLFNRLGVLQYSAEGLELPVPSVPTSTANNTTSRIGVDLRRLPWIRRLAADYVFNFPAVAPFFSGNPTEPSAWTDAIARAQGHVRRRHDIVAVLAAQQERRGAPARAREAARQLADPNTVAIVTGQQAGLFGGPLFTLLKAVTALKLADQVSRERQVTVVPIFWIDAEDHDWDEVRSCTVFDPTLATHTVSLPAREGGEPLPIASICLDPIVNTALDDLERVLAPTDFRAGILNDLRSAYAQDLGMAHAFGRWLERVLGDRGLVVYESSDPAAKSIATPVFVRELSSPGETSRLVSAAGADLTARGYHAQVQPQDDAAALFYLDGSRRPIRHRDGQFSVGDETFADAALVTLAAERPTLFSPNVVLRPIVQDTLFPTICYVAGPNELGYLAQLRRVYDRFGVPMPLIYPRASATLVDGAGFRFLQKHDLPFESLQAQDESALNQLLQAQMPPSVEESFASAVQAVDAHMARLAEAIQSLDPTLEGATKTTLGRMQHDLSTLRNKMIQAAKRRDETLRRQFGRARALAFPDGHPQERAIGFVSFLNQYGPALVERLQQELPLDVGHHWIVAV
jgi:bacillithiol biosynthesis cysteine-adding enzyme BshC